MRALVCGGRDYTDRAAVFSGLNRLHERLRFTSLIHGGAKGVEALAGEWAAMHNIPVTVYLAAWESYGRLAGGINNTKMLREGKPDCVVVFPGGKGTANMRKQAISWPVDVYDVERANG